MNSEICVASGAAGGTLFYDAQCPLCRRWARRVTPLLAPHHINLRPLQSPEAAQRLGLHDPALAQETRLLLADGRQLGGADALLEIARRLPWARPLWFVSLLPGTKPLLRRLYRIVAAHRTCRNGACQIAARRRTAWRHIWPLLVLPAASLAARNSVPPWVFMWLLALALFLACKWMTLLGTGTKAPGGAAWAYLFAWPGMDARAFLTEAPKQRPDGSEWLMAGAKTTLGFALLWLASPPSPAVPPLLAGWMGMVAIVLVLHFGVFHLLSLAWRAAGRNAVPLMRSPLLSTSLGDLWGNRWNTAFNTLASDLVFRPLLRRIGVAGATLATFAASGLIHDLVISLPAGGGYGLPTGYFLLQGVGALCERSRMGRRCGLGGGWRGRLFVCAVAGLPAFWLLHPPFVYAVILPMLQTLGILGGSQ